MLSSALGHSFVSKFNIIWCENIDIHFRFKDLVSTAVWCHQSFHLVFFLNYYLHFFFLFRRSFQRSTFGYWTSVDIYITLYIYIYYIYIRPLKLNLQHPLQGRKHISNTFAYLTVQALNKHADPMLSPRSSSIGTASMGLSPRRFILSMDSEICVSFSPATNWE